MDLVSLLPLVQPLLNKLSEGKLLRVSEANLILLYSMAENSRDMKDQMTKMREDFVRFQEMLLNLSRSLNELKVDISYVRGKIDS